MTLINSRESRLLVSIVLVLGKNILHEAFFACTEQTYAIMIYIDNQKSDGKTIIKCLK